MRDRIRVCASAVVVAALTAVYGSSALAANIAYSTTPNSGNFADPLFNWNNPSTTPSATKNAVAATGDALYFGASTITVLNNDLSGATFASLTFNSGAAAFTIGGNAFTLGGNIANNSTTAKTINNDIDLGSGSVTHAVNATSGTVTLGGVLSGASASNITVLNSTGNGLLILGGTNSYTGTTRASGSSNVGILRVTGTLNDASNVLVTGGSYDVGSDDTIGTLSVNNASVTSTTGAFTVSPSSVVFGNTGAGTFSATISAKIGNAAVGGGTLSKTGGSGNVLITGANTYSGGTTFTAGSTRIKITQATGLGSGAITQSGASTLELNLTGTNTFANTYNAITPGVVTIAGSSITTAAAPTILNTGGTNTITSNLTHANLTGGNGFSLASDAGLLTIAGNISSVRTTATVATAIGGAANGVVSGKILDNGSAQVSLVKYGAGTWTLTGDNAYATSTQIVGGTLVTGSTTALGTSNVSVTNAGTVLKVGNGTVNTVSGLTGKVIVNPDPAPPTIIPALSMADSTVLNIAAATSQIGIASGAFTLGNITLDLNNLFNADGSYVLIDGVDGANSIGTVAFANISRPSSDYSFAVVGNDGVLTVGVPEPTSLALLGLGGLGLIRRRRA